MCTCEVYRKPLSWGTLKGSKKQKYSLFSLFSFWHIKLFWLKNTVVAHLRDDASFNRVYCIKFYSFIGINCVKYHNNLIIQSDYCKENFNVNIPPKAVIKSQSLGRNIFIHKSFIFKILKMAEVLN